MQPKIKLSDNVSMNVYELAACSKLINGIENRQIATLKNKTRIYSFDMNADYPQQLSLLPRPMLVEDNDEILSMMIQLIKTYIWEGIFGVANLFDEYLHSKKYIQANIILRLDGQYLYPREHICCILIGKIAAYNLIFADELNHVMTNYLSRLTRIQRLQFHGIPSLKYLYHYDVHGFITVYNDLNPPDMGIQMSSNVFLSDQKIREKLDALKVYDRLNY